MPETDRPVASSPPGLPPRERLGLRDLAELRGHPFFDTLRTGRHGGGGTLGIVMQYAEASALYLSTGVEGVESVRRAVSDGDELAGDVSFSCIRV